ncbi:MAG: tetratricopeptide repeat protein, partial [Eudoraea sp.]|nr:tetratricopeptide repeat protein [Eudoraea sp.]
MQIMQKNRILFLVFNLVLFVGLSQTQKRTEDSDENSYRVYLDSAEFYKKLDIAKSIDFIAQSIGSLGKNPDKKELALALSNLGEVYQYHRQYDLAISNFKDAQEANKTSRTALLLGKAYIQTGNFNSAAEVLHPLEELNGLVPYQKIELYESLGDVYKG